MSNIAGTRPGWLAIVSFATFAAGAVSLLACFLTIPEAGPVGPWALLLLIVVPEVLGVIGIVFGVLAKRVLLVALNVLLLLAFPSIMLFGTLTLGR